MRRIMVACVLTFAFAGGILAGFLNHPASATTVCYMYPCDEDAGIQVTCCKHVETGHVICYETDCGQ